MSRSFPSSRISACYNASNEGRHVREPRYVDIRWPYEERKSYSSIEEMPTELSRLHAVEAHSLYAARCNALQTAADACEAPVEDMIVWFDTVANGTVGTWQRYGQYSSHLRSTVLDLAALWREWSLSHTEILRIASIAFFQLICLSSGEELPYGSFRQAAFADYSGSKLECELWITAQAAALRNLPTDVIISNNAGENNVERVTNAGSGVSIHAEVIPVHICPPSPPEYHTTVSRHASSDGETTFTLRFGQAAMSTARQWYERYISSTIQNWLK